MDIRNILLIEDDKHILQLIQELLLSLHYRQDQIITRHTLTEALQQTPASFSIVITALSLPDSPATKTFAAIQQRFSSLPVIVVSALVDEEFAISTIQAGAQDFLATADLDKRTLGKAIYYAIERKKNSNEYERLFGESPAPMYIYEPDTFRFLAVNEACVHQYGYSVEEFLNMSAEDIRPEEDRALFRSMSMDVPVHYQDFGRWTHIRKNGQAFFVHIYAHSTTLKGKQARLVTAIDVDSMVQAEKKLQEKNKEISNILESITDGFFALNDKGEFTYVNKECEKIFGFSRHQMIGKNIRAFYNTEDYAVFYTNYQQAIETRTNVRFEGKIASVNKWVSATAYPTKNGLAVYLVDITERRKIREKLFDDEQQLRAIINNTSDMIWSVDKNKNIIIANNAFRHRMQQLGDAGSNTTLPGIMATNWDNDFNKAFSGEALTFTWQETVKDKIFYDEVSFYAIRNENDDIIGVSCFSRDVTKQQLRLQKIQFQNEYLEKIAWMHSHEARAPVANILGLASLFDVIEPNDPDNTMILELIVESATQLDTAIRKIAADIDDYQLNYGDEDGQIPSA